MSRLLSLVLCLICAPAFAIDVSDGDFYDRLVAPARLDMTGGEIGELIMGGSGDDADWPWTFNISGGVVGRNISPNRDLKLHGGFLNISGGSVEDTIAIDALPTTITFHGWYFQHLDGDTLTYNEHGIIGWLADGSWVSVGTKNEFEMRGDIKVEFVIEQNDGLSGDVNGDWLVDIADLNLVRNSFGVEFDIEDLNDVRNNFGKGGPFFPAGTEGVEIHSLSTAVPEPSSIVLIGCSLLMLFTVGRSRILGR